jgi:hypothetical protein
MKSITWPVAVLFALLPFAAGSQRPSSSPQAWQQSGKSDPSRGILTSQFTLTGGFVDPPHGKEPGPPSIVLNCEPLERKNGTEGKFVSGYIQVGAPLQVKYVEPDQIEGNSYLPKVDLTYHVDSEKPQDVQWPPRSDKTAVSLDKEAVRKILRGHTVVITVKDFFETPVVMQFDVPESSEVLSTCGIRERK